MPDYEKTWQKEEDLENAKQKVKEYWKSNKNKVNIQVSRTKHFKKGEGM